MHQSHFEPRDNAITAATIDEKKGRDDGLEQQLDRWINRTVFFERCAITALQKLPHATFCKRRVDWCRFVKAFYCEKNCSTFYFLFHERIYFHHFSIIIYTTEYTQRKENFYIKGTSLTTNERTFGYGQTNVR